jgi:hypothetical protein
MRFSDRFSKSRRQSPWIGGRSGFAASGGPGWQVKITGSPSSMDLNFFFRIDSPLRFLAQ